MGAHDIILYGPPHSRVWQRTGSSATLETSTFPRQFWRDNRIEITDALVPSTSFPPFAKTHKLLALTLTFNAPELLSVVICQGKKQGSHVASKTPQVKVPQS